MKKVMTVAAIALMMAGASAFACESCGCKAKKAEKKAACSSCSTAKQECSKSESKCGADCKKACCTKKAEAKK